MSSNETERPKVDGEVWRGDVALGMNDEPDVCLVRMRLTRQGTTRPRGMVWRSPDGWEDAQLAHEGPIFAAWAMAERRARLDA